MKYIPQFTREELEENHKRFSQRAALFKGRGLDFTEDRDLVLEKGGALGGNILEIACGTGHMTLCLAKAGYKFVSIDRDEDTLRMAVLNLAYEGLLGSIEFHVMNGGALEFENNSFRNIVSANMFHHISDGTKILSEINRVLCPDGKVILSDFNKQGLEVVGSVHRQEGRVHEDSGMGREVVRDYFNAADYVVRDYANKHQWIIVGEKNN